MLILASASPRRRALLKKITAEFKVIPADIEEIVPDSVSLCEQPRFLAELKAGWIAQRFPQDIVIGADTGVFLGSRVLGKPKNEAEAKEMLRLLSGKTHRVITGCAIVHGGQCHSFSTVTQVTFYPLSDAEIESYIATGEPFDKAGGYGIQEQGALLIKEIAGDYYNVVGLPIAALKRQLDQIL